MKRPAQILFLNQQALNHNWRALLGDILSRKSIKGVAVGIIYRNGDMNTAWSVVSHSDLSWIGSKLVQSSHEDT